MEKLSFIESIGFGYVYNILGCTKIDSDDVEFLYFNYGVLDMMTYLIYDFIYSHNQKISIKDMETYLNNYIDFLNKNTSMYWKLWINDIYEINTTDKDKLTYNMLVDEEDESNIQDYEDECDVIVEKLYVIDICAIVQKKPIAIIKVKKKG